MVSGAFGPGPAPIISRMPGISQCACTSTVVTRRPPTTTCRRAPSLAGCPATPAAPRTPAPATAMPASALAARPMKCLRVGICSSPVLRATRP